MSVTLDMDINKLPNGWSFEAAGGVSMMAAVAVAVALERRLRRGGTGGGKSSEAASCRLSFQSLPVLATTDRKNSMGTSTARSWGGSGASAAAGGWATGDAIKSAARAWRRCRSNKWRTVSARTGVRPCVKWRTTWARLRWRTGRPSTSSTYRTINSH